MRYQIQQRAERQHVIFDNQTQSFTRGRFHTSADAKAWIDQQKLDATLKLIRGDTDSQYSSRAKAYLITDCDYYGKNEHNILTVAKRLLGAVRQAVIL